jgi:hypothetical protein
MGCNSSQSVDVTPNSLSKTNGKDLEIPTIEEELKMPIDNINGRGKSSASVKLVAIHTKETPNDKVIIKYALTKYIYFNTI